MKEDRIVPEGYQRMAEEEEIESWRRMSVFVMFLAFWLLAITVLVNLVRSLL